MDKPAGGAHHRKSAMAEKLGSSPVGIDGLGDEEHGGGGIDKV